ncbi:MAG: capsule biosynthesis protein, partial [Phaeobacter gallaeciensis]
MTTKPKAKKFRIRRTSSGAAAAAAARPVEAPGPDSSAKAAGATTQASASEVKSTQATASAGQKDAKPSAATGQAMSGQVSSARETKSSTDIDEIRREGLTGRQLRMARRVAQQHNLPVTSDFEAVRLLRLKGIDPFKRSNMLELVVPQNKARPEGAPDPGAIQLPQTVPAAKTTLPSTELSPAERRNKEIQEIQRDIAKRRRRKLWLLLGRLSFFVMLPTLITGYYFYAVATPMYSA